MDPNGSGRFLLVYDGSSMADRAMHVAIDRAREASASITLLAVVPPRLWRAKRGQFQISPEKHDEEWALAQLARAHDVIKDAGIHVEQLVRTGPPAHVIGEEASRGYAAVFLSARRNRTGAPPLMRIVSVPGTCEVVTVP